MKKMVQSYEKATISQLAGEWCHNTEHHSLLHSIKTYERQNRTIEQWDVVCSDKPCFILHELDAYL